MAPLRGIGGAVFFTARVGMGGGLVPDVAVFFSAARLTAGVGVEIV
jgi:hypothetical protein